MNILFITFRSKNKSLVTFLIMLLLIVEEIKEASANCRCQRKQKCKDCKGYEDDKIDCFNHEFCENLTTSTTSTTKTTSTTSTASTTSTTKTTSTSTIIPLIIVPGASKITDLVK